VTGVRRDPYAEKHRIPVEEDKPAAERGFYLQPEAYDQPEEKGIDWATHPEMMKRIKQERDAPEAPAAPKLPVLSPAPSTPPLGYDARVAVPPPAPAAPELKTAH
jgi:hypothetical protein